MVLFGIEPFEMGKHLLGCVEPGAVKGNGTVMELITGRDSSRFTLRDHLLWLDPQEIDAWLNAARVPTEA